MTLARCVLALVLLGGLLARAEAAPWVAGLHLMTLTDPVDSRPMQALAFYPAVGKTRISRIDGYPVDVAEEAPVAMGRFPLLVLSHGNTGSHWLCITWPRRWRGKGSWWWRWCTRGQRARPQSPWHPEQSLWAAAASQRGDHRSA